MKSRYIPKKQVSVDVTIENRTAPLKQVIATENAGQQALQSLLPNWDEEF